MHLLQAGVPLITIKDFLGHVDVKSTEVYIQIDLTMKREALTLVGSPARPAPKDSPPSQRPPRLARIPLGNYARDRSDYGWHKRSKVVVDPMTHLP